MEERGKGHKIDESFTSKAIQFCVPTGVTLDLLWSEPICILRPALSRYFDQLHAKPSRMSMCLNLWAKKHFGLKCDCRKALQVHMCKRNFPKGIHANLHTQKPPLFMALLELMWHRVKPENLITWNNKGEIKFFYGLIQIVFFTPNL